MYPETHIKVDDASKRTVCGREAKGRNDFTVEEARDEWEIVTRHDDGPDELEIQGSTICYTCWQAVDKIAFIFRDESSLYL